MADPILVNEDQFFRYRFPETGTLHVTGKSGDLGGYPLEIINRLWGCGYFAGIVLDGSLCCLRLLISDTEFRFRLSQEKDYYAADFGEPAEKSCLRCHESKALSEFGGVPAERSDAWGLDYVCGDCRKKERKLVAKQGNNLRRVRELSAYGSHTAGDWKLILALAGGKCLRCGSSKNISKDHVVPLARKGTNEASNLQPLCRSCNSWKGTRTVDFRDNPIP